MKNRHITKLLDKTKFTDLNEESLAIIFAHTAVCTNCRQAFRAAQTASVLLEQTDADISPPPFFQAKVMNAWREKQRLRKTSRSFRRWWQTASAMVSLMLIVVAGLLALAMFAPNTADDNRAQAGGENFYSTDSVILDKQPEDLTTEQAFRVLYDSKNSKSDIRIVK
ncbi:MAG: hypothetical protein ACR2HG_15715 [Pyrinomonadaceae bacterium]